EYAIIAVSPQGHRSSRSPAAKAPGRAKLRWDSVPGGDSYVVIRDGKEIAGPIRVEGSQKFWEDKYPLRVFILIRNNAVGVAKPAVILRTQTALQIVCSEKE